MKDEPCCSCGAALSHREPIDVYCAAERAARIEQNKPPGRSPDGSFRNCRHGAGSIAHWAGPSPRGRAAVPIARYAWPGLMWRWPIRTIVDMLKLKVPLAIAIPN